MNAPSTTATQAPGADPAQDPDYQLFVQSLEPQCSCTGSDRPCASLLAGGLCENFRPTWRYDSWHRGNPALSGRGAGNSTAPSMPAPPRKPLPLRSGCSKGWIWPNGFRSRNAARNDARLRLAADLARECCWTLGVLTAVSLCGLGLVVLVSRFSRDESLWLLLALTAAAVFRAILDKVTGDD